MAVTGPPGTAGGQVTLLCCRGNVVVAPGVGFESPRSPSKAAGHPVRRGVAAAWWIEAGGHRGVADGFGASAAASCPPAPSTRPDPTAARKARPPRGRTACHALRADGEFALPRRRIIACFAHPFGDGG